MSENTRIAAENTRRGARDPRAKASKSPCKRGACGGGGGAVAIEAEDRVRPDVLGEPDAKPAERIKDRGNYKITPAAHAFIVRCVLTGYTDAQINNLLREKKFLADGQKGLAYNTLQKIRDSDECRIDVSRLTSEARQVGHNRLARTVIYWAELQDAAYEMLTNNRSAAPRPGTLGYGLKPMTVAEVSNLLATATRFLTETFGSDLAARVNAELDADVAGIGPRYAPTLEEMNTRIDEILNTSYDKVMGRLYAEARELKRQAAEAGTAEAEEGPSETGAANDVAREGG